MSRIIRMAPRRLSINKVIIGEGLSDFMSALHRPCHGQVRENLKYTHIGNSFWNSIFFQFSGFRRISAKEGLTFRAFEMFYRKFVLLALLLNLELKSIADIDRIGKFQLKFKLRFLHKCI